MAKFVDHFGKSGANYAAYRPEYPLSVFEKVLAYTEGCYIFLLPPPDLAYIP
jgi:hypothetical protein